MPELSVVYLTYRPGGIDLLGQSLLGCQGDWELIVVDDYAGRVERGVATRYLKEDCGLPLAWHGISKQSHYITRGKLANAMNTGAMRASGSTVVFLHDYTMPPKSMVSDWLTSVAKHGPKMLIHGVAIEHSAPKPESPEDVVTWQTMPARIPIRPWVPYSFELFYVGIPMSFLRAINGVDERGDHSGPTIMTALTNQSRLLGYDFTVDQSLILKMVDHRQWEESADSDALWKIKGHVASDMEPLWSVPSCNGFGFSDG